MTTEAWAPAREGLIGSDVLQGQHVTLWPMGTPGMADRLAAGLTAEPEELWRWMGIGPFPDLASFHAMLAKQASRGVHLMVIEPRGEEPAGMAAFMRMKPDYGVAEIGSVAYGARLQRSRAGTEAIFLMLQHIFEDYGWRRAEWICNASNDRSFRAGQRYGFTYEGTFRQHRWIKGRNRDTKWLAMLDGEWPERKASFEAWLDDSNFDERGQQIRPLSAFRAAEG